MEGHNKRKRDYEGTVVTFYTPDTTFRRVFKGQSLEETKDLVRKKLGLSNDTSIRFSQLHEGRHIDLEDEDDFEAFQHLARHSLSLDLSVFVGNTGSPIFSHMPSAPALRNQVVSKKRKKNRADGPPTTVPPEVTSERSTPASVPVARPSASTIDTNGMPKKKRKRGEDAGSSQLQGMSPQDVPTRAKDGSRAEEHASSEHSKKKSRKDKKAGATLASDPLPLASASREPPSVPVGSKRKRQDTPEVTTSRSSAPSVVAAPSPRSPSPSSPIRKKRKKEKRVQVVEEPSTPAAKTTENAKKDKKGKRKADEAAQPMERPIAVEAHVSEPGEGDAADAEDNGVLVNTPKKDKKRKKKRIASHEASELEAQPSQPPAGTPKKKRKHKETGSIDDTSAPPDPTSATDEPSVVAKALKEKRKKPKASELTTDMEDSSVVIPAELATIEAAPSVPVEAQPVSGKRKRDRKSKANETLAVPDRSMVAGPTPEVVPEEAIPGSSSAPVMGEPKPKEGKKKRRKTLAADTSVDPDASSASISATEVHQVEAPSASAPPAETTPSKKRNKRKSVAVSPSQRPSDPEGTFAIVQAAVQAILARAPAPAATQEQEHPPSIPEPEPEPILPGRKRKAGQSKLRQAWGPEDIADDDQPSASVSSAVAQDLDTAASGPAKASSSSASVQLPSASASPSSASAQLAKQPSKAVNGKKGRPSSMPSCPICDKATAHPRSECPVVQGGPEALRVRIAQLKKTGRNIDLVEELEVLLKEAQRRRKSLGDQRSGGVPAPINVPSGSGHTSDEATPSPVFPLSAAKFTSPTPSRPPLPRVPAGSEISEVAVESKDEGSSNESESEDDSEEERNDRDNVASTSVALPDVSVTDLASVDLEALLRGPVKPRGSILNQIPSESTTEEEKESDDDARPDEDVDLSEEDKNDRAYRRLSRKLERAASSSEDEPEPEPEVEPGTADVDSAETFVPPTIMDADPNDTVGQVSDIEEADVSMADPDVLPETSAGSPSKGQAAQDDAEGAVTKSPTEERSDPGYESDAGDAATPASPSVNGREKAKPGDESLEVEQATEEQSGPDVSSAGRGDDNRVEHTADVDGPVASQESPAPPERSRNEPLSSPSDAAPGAQSDVDEAEAASNEEHGVEGVHNAEGEDASESEDVDEAMVDKSAEEQREVDQALSEKDDDEAEEKEPVPNTSAEREQSPELGGPESVPEEATPEPTPPPPPLRQLDPITEDVEMHASSSSRPASSLDLHRDHDPSDPIESLGSFADISERRNALDEDPIEDADADHQSPEDPSAQDGLNQTASSLDELQEKGTPPPAAPRTPGTISRMKDRYGRLSRKEKLSSLSEQLLGSIPSSSQPEPEPAVEGGGQEEPNTADEAQPAPEPVMTQEAGASSQQTQQEEDQNARPRRTTRVTTRRTSAMPRGNTEPPAPAPTAASVALPPATEPAAAPAPKRRGGRLTAEEKAAREAEKKAEKERKAAEKKAEKEAKEAAKRAEKEAKEAVKRAEKEAKEAAKRAAQQEKEKEKEGDDAPKKGRTRAARGRATAAKPVSTRSRAVAKAETEEPEEKVDETEAPADPPASSTPGFSKVSWTTLPHPQTQSEIAEAESSMVDELQPSSPGQTSPAVSRSPEPVSNLTTNTEKDEADVSREVTITQDRSEENENGEDLPAATPKPPARQKEPLFIPSSSQFPNTPFPGDGLPESTPYANAAGRGNDSDSEAGEDAEDAQEGDDVFKVPRTRPRANWEPPYRRLSDIASQQLFSPTNIPSPALFAASQSQPRKSGFNHQAEDDDDDDEDDESDGGSSSDSDADRKKSHIPQERRAGAGVQKKKKPGLLASLG